MRARVVLQLLESALRLQAPPLPFRKWGWMWVWSLCVFVMMWVWGRQCVCVCCCVVVVLVCVCGCVGVVRVQRAALPFRQRPSFPRKRPGRRVETSPESDGLPGGRLAAFPEQRCHCVCSGLLPIAARA